MTTMPHIPDAEFQQRADRTRQAMQSAGLDLLLAFSTESEPPTSGIMPITGRVSRLPRFDPTGKTSALLIGPETRPTPPHARKYRRYFNSRIFASRRSRIILAPSCRIGATSSVSTTAPDRHCRLAHVPAYHDGKLRVAAGAAEIVNADEVVRSVTLAKTENELNCMRRAKISELGFKAILENIKVGMTEVQLAGIATAAMWPMARKPPDTPSGVAAGRTRSRPSAARAIARCRRAKSSISVSAPKSPAPAAA